MMKITEKEMITIINLTNIEYEFGLSKIQVNNILKKLQNYSFDEKYEYLILEYASKIRCAIKDHVDLFVHPNNRKKYYFYNTIDYSIKRALAVIDDEIIVEPIADTYLEDNISLLQAELKMKISEKNKKTLKLNIHVTNN